MFHFNNPAAKFLFFLFREGPRLTYQKIRSSFFQREVIKAKGVGLSFGLIRATDAWAIAVGPQDCWAADRHVFPKECVMTVESDRNIAMDVALLNRYFADDPDAFESLYYYSRYSEIRLDFNLIKVIEQLYRETRDSIAANSIVDFEHAPKELAPAPVCASKRGSRRRYEYDLFMAGAGVYAYAYVLPILKAVNHHTIIDLNPLIAGYMAEKFRFQYADTSCDRALNRLAKVAKPILVIATYHSTHLAIAEKACSINPNTRIMIEKPPVTTTGQLESLVALRQKGHVIEIGYNRRYAWMTRQARQLLRREDGPTSVTCIVKEKSIPLNHWYYWPGEGTRITGNISHWIDLGCHLIGSKPIRVVCVSASESYPADEPLISIFFEDNSVLTIIASDRGNEMRGIQEYIDIRKGGLTIQIDDFLSMKVLEKSRRKVFRHIYRDKGHKRMYLEFYKMVEGNRTPKYPESDLMITTSLYLQIKDALFAGISDCRCSISYAGSEYLMADLRKGG